MTSKLIHRPGQIELYADYDRNLIAELRRQIPDSDKRPVYVNGKFSHWSILPKHHDLLVDLIQMVLNEMPLVITARGIATKQAKMFNLRYIGSSKERRYGSAVNTSLGYVNDDWHLEVPEEVLIDWFDFGFRPSKPKTLYGVLGVDQSVSSREIKRAYRLMAKKYHPDMSTGNQQKFLAVQGAYEFLSDKKKRKLYDLGLKEDSKPVAKNSINGLTQYGYTPPIKCGLVLCEGEERLGLFRVSKILKWEPIIRNGLKLETSYDIASHEIVEEWV